MLKKLFFILLLSLLLHCSRKDTSDSFTEIINLSGNDWYAILDDDIEYAGIEVSTKTWTEVEQPSNLRNLDPEYRGVIWIRKSFDIDTSNIKKNLALSLGKIYDYDEVYLNGNLLGQNGKKVGSKDSSQPAYNRQRIYPIPEKFLSQGTNVLAVKIRSDFRNYAGILSGEIGISTLYSVVDSIIYESLSDLIYLIAFVFIGIFFFINYLKMPEFKEYLTFSIFIIIFSFYEFFKNEFRFWIYDSFLIFKYLELIFLYNIPFFYIIFFQSFFKIEKLKYQNYYFLTNFLVAIIFLVFKNPDLWTTLTSLWSYHLIFPLAYSGYKAFEKVKKKQIDAILYFIALLYFVYGTSKEILIEKGFLHTESSLDNALLVFILLVSIALRYRFLELKINIQRRFDQLNEIDNLREKLFQYLNQILMPHIESSLQTVRAMKVDHSLFNSENLGKINQSYAAIDNSLDDIIELSRLEVKRDSPLKDTVYFVDFIKTIIPENEITYTIKVDPAFQINNTLDLINSLMIRIIDFSGFKNFTSKDLIVTSDLKDHLHFRFMFYNKEPRITQNLYKQLSEGKFSKIEVVRWAIIKEILRLLDGKLEMGLINKKYLRIDFELIALPLHKESKVEKIVSKDEDSDPPKFNFKNPSDWKKIKIKLPTLKRPLFKSK
jgi:hypothetical protein